MAGLDKIRRRKPLLGKRASDKEEKEQQRTSRTPKTEGNPKTENRKRVERRNGTVSGGIRFGFRFGFVQFRFRISDSRIHSVTSWS